MMAESRSREQELTRRQLATAVEELASSSKLPVDARRWLAPILRDLLAGLEPGGAPDRALRSLGRIPRRRTKAHPAAPRDEAPSGGFLALTSEEIDVLVDCVLEPPGGESLLEQQARRRRAFALSLDFIDAGVALPEHLLSWLIDRLRSLRDALQPGKHAALAEALHGLGKAPKGRPPQGRHEVEIAAAVAVLARYAGKSRAVDAVVWGLDLPESEVWRICKDNDLRAAWQGFGGVVFGVSVDGQRTAAPSEQQEHALAISLAGEAVLQQIGLRLKEIGQGDLWPSEMDELFAVTRLR